MFVCRWGMWKCSFSDRSVDMVDERMAKVQT